MAKKFKFRVESILKMREHTEQRALRTMADASGKVAEIENRIRDMRARVADQNRLVREGVLTGSVNVQYMSLYRRHVMALNRRMIELGRDLHEAAVELANRRAEAVEAVKQRKVLTKLKDRQHAKYMKALQRDELRQTDDMTLMRIGHQRTDGWN